MKCSKFRMCWPWNAASKEVGKDRLVMAPDPLKRGNMVKQTMVAGVAMGRLGGELGIRKEAEDSKAVIDRDDCSLGGQIRAIADRNGTCTLREATAVDEDDDGKMN